MVVAVHSVCLLFLVVIMVVVVFAAVAYIWRESTLGKIMKGMN